MLAAPPRDETESAMRKFLAKHAAATIGTRSCFDRLFFKGQLSLGYPQGWRIASTTKACSSSRSSPSCSAKRSRSACTPIAPAEKAGRPWQYFESPVRED
jgi:hypothetical protein